MSNKSENTGGMPSGAQIQQMQQQHQQMQAQHLQLAKFWTEQTHNIDMIDSKTHDFKGHQLPLARIKKIMKQDEEVKMISAEAPVLFSKACELFIHELTMRAWNNTEESKRRTLQRNDIASAITKTDMFDFLIDIVPRDDVKGATRNRANMDAQMMYHMQLQQQQAMMMQQYMQQMQSAGAAAGQQLAANSMGWNPQQIQQIQQQMMDAANGNQNGNGTAPGSGAVDV